MSKTSVTDLPQLTSLRFFAAFAILVLHYRDFYGPLDATVMALVVGGQFGVTFFFVLSGFIMTYNYETTFAPGLSSKDFWRFQKFRFARIYPTYLLALLIDTPVQIMICHSVELGSPVYWMSWLINVYCFQSWIPFPPFTLVWNTPSWSISTEFFFYLCFPVICFFLARFLKLFTHAVWLALFVVIVSLITNMIVINQTYVVHVLNPEVSFSIQHYLPPLRLPEFIIGCIAGRIFVEIRSGGLQSSLFKTEFRRNMALIICFAITMVRILMPSYTGPDINLWLLDNACMNIFCAIPFAGIILSMALGKTMLSKILAWPFLVLLGDSSYALYITHFAGFNIRSRMFAGDSHTLAISLIFMFVAVVESVVLYLCFERPIRRMLRRSRLLLGGQ